MRHDQFLRFAEGLLKRPPNAALARSAISRAYYAAYHHAREFITFCGAVPPQSHQKVFDALDRTGAVRSWPDAALFAVASELNELRRVRNAADYDLADRRVERVADAQEFVERVQAALDALDACRADPARCRQLSHG